MKKLLFSILIILLFSCQAQKQTSNKQNIVDRPKLVIGIVVDQMRYDYLIKFYNKYGEGGFKRLMTEGFNCENTHFNYIPTHTAVGHSSIYTGTTPSMHGIISNDWYDKELKEFIYCVDDDRYTTIGSDKGGQKSPYRLETTTVTDQLKLVVKNKGKVIGISIKDRASILPSGHSADGAYWFRGKKEANFITSSFYMNTLPKWVTDFNESSIAEDFMQVWKPLYDLDTYTETIADDNNFENTFKGEDKPVFPHDFPKLMKENGNYDLLKLSPFVNSLLERFAEASIIGEKLGQDAITDFLTISFSSTDYIGHMYGPDSKEIEDTYLRLDKEIARFLTFLDNEVGVGEYSLFLTADHAVAPNPSYLQSKKINAGYFNKKKFIKYVSKITTKYFKSDQLIAHLSNYQIFLDIDKIEELGLDYDVVAKTIKNKTLLFEGVYKTVTAETLQTTNFTEGILASLQNGYNQKYSGDILIVPKPAYLYKKMKGTSHGSGYSYDTHVPLLFFGKGFKNGHSKKHINIIDIAPTISNLLQIEFPNGCTGKIIDIK